MPTSLLLILTAAGFGASPLLIAEAVAHFPPWTLAALRAALGLPLLLLAAGALGPQRRPSRHDLLTALVGGTLVVTIPFVSMAAGMQYIPSGMGGMLYATMPLFTLALAALFLADEPASAEQALRIGTGLIGVAMISVPAIQAGGFAQAGFGTLMVLISPLSYAAGNVWFRRRRKMAPLVLSAGMFAVGALTVWPMALLIDGRVTVEPSLSVIGTLAALVVLATIAPNLLNYALVQRAGANKAALAMFLMPAFSVLFGMVFRGERLPMLAFVGLALVILASTARVPGLLRRGGRGFRRRGKRVPVARAAPAGTFVSRRQPGLQPGATAPVAIPESPAEPASAPRGPKALTPAERRARREAVHAAALRNAEAAARQGRGGKKGRRVKAPRLAGDQHLSPGSDVPEAGPATPGPSGPGAQSGAVAKAPKSEAPAPDGAEVPITAAPRPDAQRSEAQSRAVVAPPTPGGPAPDGTRAESATPEAPAAKDDAPTGGLSPAR